MRENCVRWVRAQRVGGTREKPPESVSYGTRCKMEGVGVEGKRERQENGKGNDEEKREKT